MTLKKTILNFYFVFVKSLDDFIICMTTANDIEQLFRSNFKAMFILANRLVRDEETARDIVHDVFASLLSDSPETITTAFLFKGVRFACLNHIRNLSIRQRLNKLYALELDEIEDEEWPDEDDIAWLNSVLDRHLSEQCRRVVRLRFSDHLSYRELAETLGISETAVYKHLRHALDVLRLKFKDYGKY
ncbi:MAG: sigma-70 family RNA polymerase sigma factor [Bacteroidales bacterium]|nr:sigma-70 family RNA polymerase sigma factor [Bacteroidales bacterium]MBD5283634.1 sigma-70 family RNA polymerase sigma factor [Bacteroides sp.]